MSIRYSFPTVFIAISLVSLIVYISYIFSIQNSFLCRSQAPPSPVSFPLTFHYTISEFSTSPFLLLFSPTLSCYLIFEYNPIFTSSLLPTSFIFLHLLLSIPPFLPPSSPQARPGQGDTAGGVRGNKRWQHCSPSCPFVNFP